MNQVGDSLLQLFHGQTDRLSKRLQEASDALRSKGIIPERNLAEEILDLHMLFEQILQEIQMRWEKYGKQLSEIPQTIGDLQHLCEQLQKEESYQQKAGWFLKAARLESKFPSDHEDVASVREQANGLHVRARCGEHLSEEEVAPFIALVRLLTEGDLLSDEEWADCDRLVRNHFDQVISLAVMRKRLYIADGEANFITESLINPVVEVNGNKGSSFDGELVSGKLNTCEEVATTKEMVSELQQETSEPAIQGRIPAAKKVKLQMVKSPMNPEGVKSVIRSKPFHPLMLFSKMGLDLKGLHVGGSPDLERLKKALSLNKRGTSMKIKSVKIKNKVQINQETISNIEAPIDADNVNDDCCTLSPSLDVESVSDDLALVSNTIGISEGDGETSLSEVVILAVADNPLVAGSEEHYNSLLPMEAPPSIQIVPLSVSQNVASFAYKDEEYECSIEELADKALACFSDDPVPDMQILLWKLLDGNRLSEAYRIAEAMEKNGRTGSPVPSSLIRGIILSQHVRHNSGYIMHLLKEDFENILSEFTLKYEQEEWATYLLAAAAYRSTILAPSANGSQMLGKIVFTGKLYELNEEIRMFGQNFIPLDPQLLRSIRSEASWQADLNELRTRVESEMIRLSNIKILFAPASKVWKRWMEKGGVVQSLLDPIRSNDTDKIPTLKENLELYSDPSELQRMVDYTDRTELGRNTGTPILARAFMQIQTHFYEVMTLVQEWIDLIEIQPGHLNQFNQKEAKRLQNGLQSRRDIVLEQITTLSKENKPFPVRASIEVLRRALENVFSLFDRNSPISNRESDPNCVMNEPFLTVPDIALQQNWQPYYPGCFPLDALLYSLREPKKDIVEAFNSRIELQDLEGAQLILRLLEQRSELNVSIDQLDEMRGLYDRRSKECQDSLYVNIRDCKKRVEQDFTLNLLDETKRSNHLALLETMERQVKETTYFPEAIEKLDQLRAELEVVRKKAAEKTWSRFEELGVNERHEAFEKIAKVLNDGDLHTANDYLLRLQSNQPIDLNEQTREPLHEYFDSKFFNEIMDYLERTNVRRIVQEMKTRQMLGPLSIGNVPGAQKDQAAEMIEAWYEAKKSNTGLVVEERNIRTILNGIGLQVRTVTKHTATRKGRPYQTIHTVPISDRTRCPIPLYGSQAHGQYRIYSFWDRMTEEDIMHEIGETSRSESPVIVMYFGRLTAQKRRDLARLSRERRRTFVILDETLLFFLCGERGSRLPVFFKCALPFTFAEPYSITGSILREEMFYGRQYELDSILEGKSGLVYGGRQLGKTALLRAAERRFHNPEEGKYAALIDLKAEGIGSDKLIDDIWGLIARELNRIGIQEIRHGLSSADKLCDQISTWIGQDSSRRLLLLLDESDRFLESDASEYGSELNGASRGTEGFIRCSKLKGLMESTDKRVHIVFAGLHNVQRSYKNKNDPLAHLGEPICVGPLFAKEEWREAWALVERPFAAMGYFFESRDLITRILSQTNYYPSLIQLYCHQLLRHMTEHRALASFFSKNTPLYEITSKHVDEVYQNRELQKAIRHRFKLTLQLDARYELIANIVAYESLIDDNTAKQGMSTKEIKEKALEYWHQGFKYLDSFWVLLDEMVDLGVLRRVREGYFALRNPNLLSLMGPLDEIEDELLRERVVQVEYNAAHFRAAYYLNGQNENLSERSPLTAEQDSELRRLPSSKRVSIIFGNRAAGIGEVAKFLEMGYDKNLHVLSGLVDVPSFIRNTEAFIEKNLGHDSHILVETDCAWTPEWVKKAGEILQVNKMERVRISFLSDPEQTMTLVRTGESFIDEFSESGIVMLHLQPWHPNTLIHWLTDCDLEKSNQVQAEILSVTGNWPSILMRLYDRARMKAYHLQAQLHKLKEDMSKLPEVNDILAEMGITRKEWRKVLTGLSLAESKQCDIAVYCDMPEGVVRSILTWAELIGIVRYLGKDTWAIDSVVGGLLQAVEEEHA